MAEILFNQRKSEVKLAVKKQNNDGTIEEKDLVFDCAATNYSFIKRAVAAGKKISAALAGGIDADKVDAVLAAEREAFEVLAPGRWDEFFAFLDEDVEYMAQLAREMLETARSKGVEAKAADVAPVVPDGESV